MGKETFKILTLNNISVRGLERLPRDRYEVASEIGHPDAILLRSADMHEMDVPSSVSAGRAALQARHSCFQCAGRQRECGQGAGNRGYVPRGPQHLPGVGIRARAQG